MFKLQNVRWCGFRCSIPLSIECVWNSSIDRATSTLSYSYCIWNRWWQNHPRILPNLLLFVWFDTVEFNRLPCSNNKMYNDAVFADRFHCPLAMFRFRIVMWLSRLLHAHIAYEVDTAILIEHSSEFPIICMIWYAWIHSSAMFKQKNVRCCGFRWSIPLSIDYV